MRDAFDPTNESQNSVARHQAPQQAWTLPLFAAPADDADSGQHHSTEPREMVLQVYWSASNEILALGGAARRDQVPDQKRALVELLRLERRRKDLARELLAHLWQINFNSATAAATR